MYEYLGALQKRYEAYNGTHEPQPQAFGCWVAEWLTRARVCSVYAQLCGWQAG